jgi:hypothetical protein
MGELVLRNYHNSVPAAGRQRSSSLPYNRRRWSGGGAPPPAGRAEASASTWISSLSGLVGDSNPPAVR